MVVSTVFVCVPRIALAQEAGAAESDPWAGIEEMLVIGTGGGALGLIAETGSVTAFDAEDLAAYGVENTADLADFTPNLEIVQSSATQATFFIRGVGLQDFSSNAAGAVAVYVDGIPYANPTLQIAPIFDAESVQVLRGPQGRGNWRNATGGVIAIASRKPSMDSIAANFSMTQGSFYSVDAIDAHIQNYSAAMSVPIIPGVLATRFAFQSSDSDPFFTNRCGLQRDRVIFSGGQFTSTQICGEPSGPINIFAPDLDRNLPLPPLKKEVGKRSVYSLRSSWMYTPDTPFDLEVIGRFTFSRRDQDGNFGQSIGASADGQRLGVPTQAANGGAYQEPDSLREREALEITHPGLTAPFEAFNDNFSRTRPLDKRPYEGDFNRNGLQRVELMTGSLEISGTVFDTINIESKTGVARIETNAIGDSDFAPIRLFEIDTINRASQVAQNLTFSGELEPVALTWEFGGYFLWEDLETQTSSVLPIGESIRIFSQDTFSYGLFGGFGIDFLDDFTLAAGARFNWEEKQFDIQDILRFPSGNGSVNPGEETKLWTEPTGTIELSYRFSESTSTYLKYNHGFKPGHFNSTGVEVGGGVRNIAAPEKIDAFEFGFSGSYLDDRLSLTGAIFFYDYQQYQVFLFQDSPRGPPTLEVLNANDARVFGAEIEARIQPLLGIAPEAIEGLELTLLGGWLDSEFLDFTATSLSPSADRAIQLVTEYTGNPLLNSPRFTVNGGIRWPLIFGKLGTIEPRYDFAWVDDQFFGPDRGIGGARANALDRLPEFTLGQRAYALHNVRLTYRPPESEITISGWCRNVADERYKNFAFDVSRFRGVVVNLVGDPRSCGADISYSW